MIGLDEKRNAAADAEFESFDFGWQIEDASGWEWTQPGNEWTKPVFCANEENPDGPSVPGSLVVVFEDGGADIRESYAVVEGVMIQGRTPPAPAPN